MLEISNFSPSNFTIAGVWTGAVSVKAGLSVDRADGHLAQLRLVTPTWHANDVALVITEVRF
jgi:hypothetical protein